MSPAERYAYDEHLSAIMIQNDVLDRVKLEGRMEGKNQWDWTQIQSKKRQDYYRKKFRSYK